MQNEKSVGGCLLIKDRKCATVSGVKSILGFDEDYVALETELGKLVLEGEKMKIDSLIKDEGTVNITGCISTAYYSERKKTSGLLSRWFS